MAHRSSSVVLALSAWLIMSSLSGCNGVLGIEEARPSASNGGQGNSSGGSGGAGPLTYTGADSCIGAPAANANCSTCLAKQCSSAVQNQCLQDHTCREQMDYYGACLTSSCTLGDCFEQQLLQTGMQVNDCYASCSDACAASPIYSACQLYCACMGSNCPDKINDMPVNGEFKSMADCIAVCSALPAEIVTCRRTHCELAGLTGDLIHCDHATGVTFCEVGTTQTDRDSQCTDKSKSLISFACRSPSDCCSGNCSAQMACAPQ
jgi:hypothetical protein